MGKVFIAPTGLDESYPSTFSQESSYSDGTPYDPVIERWKSAMRADLKDAVFESEALLKESC